MIVTFNDSEDAVLERIKSFLVDEVGFQDFSIDEGFELLQSDLTIKLRSHTVYLNDTRISLGNFEYKVLCYLAKHPGWIYTKEQIYKAVYGRESLGNIDNLIYCLIRSLRKKLEPDPRQPRYIITVRGVGYKFVK